MQTSKQWRRVCAVFILAAGLILVGCGDDAPHHELRCDDGVDDDGDGRVDCEDTDCWGTPQCPEAECGDNVAEGMEECDGSDFGGWTCLELGYDAGSLGCTGDCVLVTSGCTGDPVCGNGVIDTGEECDGAALGGATCADFGFTTGTVTCDASCVIDESQCEGRLLAECYDYGDLSGGVNGELTCASEVGAMQWDWYSLEVQAGDCVDIVVDNGAGAADVVAYAKDADGVTAYGLAADNSQLDDELECAQDPWSGWACPAATVEVQTTGTFQIYVAQWEGESGTVPGVDTCALGMSAYTLFVAVNGDATSVVLEQNDQPL